MKKIFLLILLLTLQVFAQWRDAIIDTTITAYRIAIPASNQQVYRWGDIIWNDKEDTTWVSWIGQTSSDMNIGYISPNSPDSLFFNAYTSSLNGPFFFGAVWQINNRSIHTSYNNSLNIAVEFEGEGEQLTNFTDFSGYAYSMRGCIVGDTMYSAFTVTGLSKTYDNGGVLVKDQNFIVPIKGTLEGNFAVNLNDTVFVSLAPPFSFQSFPDTGTYKGAVWCYVPATGDTLTYINNIVPQGKVRWISQVCEVQGRKFVLAQSDPATGVQGLYEITGGVSQKIQTPNDSSSYLVSIEVSNSDIFISTGSLSLNDSTETRIFKYSLSEEKWYALPSFINNESDPDQYPVIGAMKYNKTTSYLYCLPIFTGGAYYDTYYGTNVFDRKTVFNSSGISNKVVLNYYYLPAIEILQPTPFQGFYVDDSVKVVYSSPYETNIVFLEDIPIDTISTAGLIDSTYIHLNSSLLDTVDIGDFPTELAILEIKVADIGGGGETTTSIVLLPPSGFIEILSATVNSLKEDTLDVSAVVYTAGIDSFNVFYKSDSTDWKFIEGWLTDTTETITTTDINFSILLSLDDSGELYLKAEDARDTNIVIEPRKYHATGGASTPDHRICYGNPNFNGISSVWVFDVACGWNALACYEGGETSKIDNFIYPKYDPEYADTLNLKSYATYRNIRWCGSCVDYETDDTIPNAKICRGQFISRVLRPLGADGYLFLIDSLAIYHMFPTFGLDHSKYAVYNQPYVYKNYRYWIDENEGKVYVDDLLNQKDSILFCDYSKVFDNHGGWTIPYFPSTGVSYVFSIFPYSKARDHLVYSNFSWNMPAAKQDSLLADQEILDTFVPELRIVCNSGFHSSISIPMLGEPPDGRPLAYDIYQLNLEEAGLDDEIYNSKNGLLRRYFRGIKPRANRHQKYPYNLKGR